MADTPWYKDGLRFECTGCGDCCTGAPGYVWVSDEEIVELAAVVGMSIAQFERQYIRQVGKRKSLIEYENGDCVFFDGETKRCNVYPARPYQCRTWPFWNSNLATPATWRDTCRRCPGSGQGKLYTVGEVLAQSRVVDV